MMLMTMMNMMMVMSHEDDDAAADDDDFCHSQINDYPSSLSGCPITRHVYLAAAAAAGAGATATVAAIVVVVVVVVVAVVVAAATRDQAAAQLRGFRTGFGRNFGARRPHQAPFRTVEVCAAFEPCASPFCYRCGFDPPGPNSWAQTLFKPLHLWVGGRVSTSAQWRGS